MNSVTSIVKSEHGNRMTMCRKNRNVVSSNTMADGSVIWVFVCERIGRPAIVKARRDLFEAACAALGAVRG